MKLSVVVEQFMSSGPSPEALRDYSLVILIKEIFSQLDEVALLRKQGRKANISTALLQEMCSVLPELEPQLRERYFEILIKTSVNQPSTSSAVPSDEYIHASQTPKRRTISRVRSALGLKAA